MTTSNSSRDAYEAQKVADILLILEQLVQREDATVRFLMERLYDIGIYNLLKKKMPLSAVKPTLKRALRLPRPVFRFLSTRWFKQNGPRLITEWLHSLVDLEPKEEETNTQDAAALDTTVQPVLFSSRAIATAQEVQQLRSQVRWLMTVMVSAIALLSSTFFWVDYELKPAATEFLEQIQSGDLSATGN